MKMKHEDVVKKIKKLLDRAERSSDNEARVALGIALDLLAKYNISIEEVKKDYSDKSKFVRAEIDIKGTPSVFHVYVANILRKFFFVFTAQTALSVERQQFYIYGKRHNVEIAWYVFHSLERQFNNLWERYISDGHPDRIHRDAYWRGLYQGIALYLQSESKNNLSNKSLVIADKELEDYCQSKFISGTIQLISDKDRRNYSEKVIKSGRKDAEKIQILPAIKKKSA